MNYIRNLHGKYNTGSRKIQERIFRIFRPASAGFSAGLRYAWGAGRGLMESGERADALRMPVADRKPERAAD